MADESVSSRPPEFKEAIPVIFFFCTCVFHEGPEAFTAIWFLKYIRHIIHVVSISLSDSFLNFSFQQFIVFSVSRVGCF